MALQEEFKTQGDFLFKNRSYLPLIILIVGVGVFMQTEYYEIESPDNWFEESYEFTCLLISLLGLFIRVITVGHTPGETQKKDK